MDSLPIKELDRINIHLDDVFNAFLRTIHYTNELQKSYIESKMSEITILPMNHGSYELRSVLYNFVTSKEEHFFSITEADYKSLPDKIVTDLNRVITSLFNVIKETETKLKENPNVPIIIENCNGSTDPIYEFVMPQVFPNGLPSSPSEMSLQQKITLLLGHLEHYFMHIHSANLCPDDTSFVEDEDKIERELYNYPNYPAITSNLEFQKNIDINQRREYKSLKNAINIVGDGKGLLIYGGMHFFKDLDLCFPGHTIYIDYSVDKIENLSHKAKVSSKAYEQCMPPPDCKYLELPWQTPPRITNKCILFDYGTEQTRSSNFSPLAAIGEIALLGLCCYGMFKCCKKARSFLTKPHTGWQTRPPQGLKMKRF